ncbi:hypothetical protein [Methanolobus sp.]|uniref:hypothetical protein n=1 Tax=Methanolobus sp. TaxID=1874737 RepID=UPI0025CFCD6D|nr:hypothetical protein [Methanolobus sp.]
MSGKDTSGKSISKGKYALIASLASSLALVILFAVLAVAVNSSRGGMPPYTQVDIIAGMVFVFVLSMIVSASVWPGIVEKKMKNR